MNFFARFFIRLKWRVFPASSRAQRAEAEQFGELLAEIFPLPRRTESEQAAFDLSLKQSYLKGVKTPLFKRDAIRVTKDEEWKQAILSLRSLPVRFRVKLIETSNVTSWHTGLERGIFDSHFIFPDHGSISYEEIEWLELNACELNKKELEHFGEFLHNTEIMQCHELPLSMEIHRLFGYHKLPDKTDIHS